MRSELINNLCMAVGLNDCASARCLARTIRTSHLFTKHDIIGSSRRSVLLEQASLALRDADDFLPLVLELKFR